MFCLQIGKNEVAVAENKADDSCPSLWLKVEIVAIWYVGVWEIGQVEFGSDIEADTWITVKNYIMLSEQIAE